MTPGTAPQAPSAELAPEREGVAETALAILTDSALEPIVDMVLLARHGGYEAHSHDGSVRFRRDDRGAFGVLSTSGTDPLANQATDTFSPLRAELDHPYPGRAINSYPQAFERISQLFDHPAAPDLCVLHSAAHNWVDHGGHRGEHGSLGIVQSRAPLVFAGKGVRRDGVVPRSARLVDVAPTLLTLLGVEPDGDGQLLAGQDGVVLDEVLDPSERPRHVVAFLFDGTNPNVLYDMAACSEAPNVARLMGMGTTYAHGAIAGLPTITLANHTSVITGRFPGHHGILHNAWFDRRTGEEIITNSSATWPTSMQHCFDGVDSIHRALHRAEPDAFTASVNEPCDIGADYSTFELLRQGVIPDVPATPEGLPHTTQRFGRPDKNYSWSSVVDHLGVEQATGIWSGDLRGESYPVPRFMFCNFTLTDSAMHAGGPHSEIAAAAVRDCDGRLGEILAAIEQAGAFDDTAFVLMADHGMEQNNPEVTGNWDTALTDAGIDFRDEGYGFLYLCDDLQGR